MNKAALITGGIRGIGYGTAVKLAEDGYSITILDVLKAEDYPENLARLKDITGGRIAFIRGDICSAASRQEALDITVKEFGGVHVLVNNAGVAPLVRSDILEMSEESFDRVMNNNIRGAMFMTQIVANQMIKQPCEGDFKGVIVNISSISANVSSVMRAEYCVSKAAVSMLTTLYADRLGPEGILAYEIRPGIIKTDMTSNVEKEYDELFAKKLYPINRWGYPEDIGEAISMLCTGKLKYSTGIHLYIDGGFHIRSLD